MGEETPAGKVAMITGGQGDIGAAVAAELASRGARIALVDLSPGFGFDPARSRELPAATTCHRADVTDLGDMQAAAAAIVAAHGSIDILVNSAGIVVAPRRREGSPRGDDGGRVAARHERQPDWRLQLDTGGGPAP